MISAQYECVLCRQTHPVDLVNSRCRSCGEPLEVMFSLSDVLKENTPATYHFPAAPYLLQRFSGFYPYLQPRTLLWLGEGRTPLIRSLHMEKEIGVKELYFKNETQNPTWSFKDRGTCCTILHALSLGFRRLGTVSSGNMGASVAAYGGRAGMDTVIIVKENVSQEKVDILSSYGAEVFRMLGDFSALQQTVQKIGNDSKVYFSLSDDPMRIEGYKTIAFEIFEHMAGDLPDYVVVPVGSGGLFRGVLKGFEELGSANISTRIPKMIGVQTTGCSPTVDAFEKGTLKTEIFPNPQTLDHVLENPNPPSSNQVLRKLRENNGFLVKVSNEEVLAALKKLAREGIFAQPASATVAAGIARASKDGRIRPDSRIVVVVTGSGLKHPAVLQTNRKVPQSMPLSALPEAIFTKYGN